jgi:hypothetical protein
VLDGLLHPGVELALRRREMDETEVAEAMAAGELASPQRFANSWYFNIRITGTGAAYRTGLKEHVWRDPKFYTNEHFLKRCNGLFVILEHPPGLMLDSKEFTERNIGAVVLPYIPPDKPDEVWGISRILYEPAALYMRDHPEVVSTSPAVVFTEDSGEKIELDDGTHLFVEGKPYLLDHIAIVDLGTWDKGGPPTGVDVESRQDSEAKDSEEVMSEEHKPPFEEKEAEKDRKDRKRDDTESPHHETAESSTPDKILAGIDALGKRMDAMRDDHGKSLKALSDRMDMYDAKKRDDNEVPDNKDEGHAMGHTLIKETEKGTGEEPDGIGKQDDAKRDDDDRRDDKKRDDRARDDKRDDRARDDKKRDDRARDDKKRDDRARDDEDEEEEKEKEEKKGVPVEAESSKDKRRDDRKRDDDDDKRRDRRRDDDDDRRHDARHDSARYVSRSDFNDWTQRLADRPWEDQQAMAAAQSRADSVASALGERKLAPPPNLGEKELPYRVRLARNFQQHSAAWRDEDLARLARNSPSAFANAEAMIYADADTAARKPENVPAGSLREIVKRRAGGGEITEFVGDPIACWGAFMAPGRACTRLSMPRPRQ